MLDRPLPSILHCSLRLAALAFCASAGLLAATAPTGAMDTDWHKVCSFKSSPQGAAEMAREMVCIRLRDCTVMADVRGGVMTGMGCFGVPPDAPSAAARPANPR
ncbi:hypothetical protein [Bosea sp. R86505]|jgi:hypothetical protein|uniref:hypothetical protein n=1 Tax=Bosea sp. R86505 TaxID=3101710 RepID=UPI003672511D